MADIDQVTKKIAREVRTKGRTAALEKIRKELNGWLTELKFPSYPDATSWQDVLLEYKQTPEDFDAQKGVKVRFALKLYTTENQYLVSIMESLGAIDVGNHVLTVHVNWQSEELRKRRTLEETYGSHFNEMLKAKHTIWAQSFRDGKLTEALNAGMIAILGHELKPEPPKEHIGELLQPVIKQVPSFPKMADD